MVFGISKFAVNPQNLKLEQKGSVCVDKSTIQFNNEILLSVNNISERLQKVQTFMLCTENSGEVNGTNRKAMFVKTEVQRNTYIT